MLRPSNDGSWSKLADCGVGVFGHTVCEHKGSVVTFGGCDRNGQFSNSVNMYSIAKNEWTVLECTGSSPCSRNFHSAVVVKHSMYIFGGKSNGYHADMYYLNLSKKKWSSVSYKSKAPLARYGHTMCHYAGSIYIFGGYDAHGFCCDDLYKFEIATGIWTKVKFPSLSAADSSIQLGRFHHSGCVYKSRLLIFGGKGPDSVRGDLIEYDLEENTWRRLSGADPNVPAPRWGHSATLLGSTMYVYGGRDNISQYNDLFSYDVNSGKWALVSSNPSNSSITSNPNGPLAAPHHRYFHGAVGYEGALLFVWGKNIFDFCFSDILQFSVTPSEMSPQPRRPETSERSRSAGASTAISGKKIRLKCHYNNEIRMMSVSDTIEYSDLLSKLSSEYATDQLRLQYEDEEGDLITIRSAADLEEAFSYFEATNKVAAKLFLSEPTNSTSSYTSAGSNSADLTRRQAIKPSSLSASSHISTTSRHPVSWQLGGLIGEGAFGKVYLGMNLDTGELMAIKQVALNSAETNQQQIDALQREIELMQDLHHENIVQYLGSEVKDSKLNIFLEYQPGGSIASLLTKFHTFNENIIRSFTRQILAGLQYLHDHGIAHRDIKGANLLVDLTGRVKLADFGASKKLADIASFSEGCKTVTGSPYWMAPEVIQQGYGGATYGRKADIWSLGAVVIEMVTGKPPFHSLAPVTALFKIGSSPATPAVPDELSNNLKDFLSHCFQRDPKLRASTAELLKHPFLNEDGDLEGLGSGPATPRSVGSVTPSGSASNSFISLNASSSIELKPPSDDGDRKPSSSSTKRKKRRSKQLRAVDIKNAENEVEDGSEVDEASIGADKERDNDADIDSIIMFLREKIQDEERRNLVTGE